MITPTLTDHEAQIVLEALDKYIRDTPSSRGIHRGMAYRIWSRIDRDLINEARKVKA